MFERSDGSGRQGLTRGPHTRVQGQAEHIHRAVDIRSSQLREEMPGATVQEELQDQEPRAVLKVMEGGRLAQAEFFESTFSADRSRSLEEYVQAARECGRIVVLYPGLSFPEDYVIRKVQWIFDRARSAGVEGDLHVHGCLYDIDGHPRRVV